VEKITLPLKDFIELLKYAGFMCDECPGGCHKCILKQYEDDVERYQDRKKALRSVTGQRYI